MAFGSSSVTITNTSASGAYTEKLDAVISSSNGATGSGSISLLAGGSNSSAITVGGLSTATSGAKSGTVTLGLTSDGTGTSGLGNTSLGSTNIQVTGGVYNYAAASLASSNVNLGNIHA